MKKSYNTFEEIEKGEVRGAANRLMKTRKALFEIAFAKGWNTITPHPLPEWKEYSPGLKLCKDEQGAFELGVAFARQNLV